MQPGGQIYEALQTYRTNIGLVSSTGGLTWGEMTGSVEDYNAQID